MPVSTDIEIVRLSQAEFSAVAYTVMAEIFHLHKDMGRLFDESVYNNALSARLDNVHSEVRIGVSFRDFHKSYYMDVLASKGAVFELKATETIHPRHRSQLLNYLLLTELRHGKLVNLRSDTVVHEFVNTTLTLADRTCFDIDDSTWQATPGFGMAEKSLVIEMFRDWGSGLDISLYEEGLIHFFGGPEQVLQRIDVIQGGVGIAKQAITQCAPRMAFKLTMFDGDPGAYRKHLVRFIQCTELDAIQWINTSRKRLRFETLERTAPR